MNERHAERARSVAPLRWILKLWDLLRQRRIRGHIFDSMDGQRGSEGQLADEDDDLRVVVDQNGKRTVSWSAEIADGGPTIIQHEFPDAVRHFYQGTGVDEDVWLFQGEFSGAGGDSGYEGDVRWRWRPSPQLEARGTRPARPSDLQDALSVSGDMWIAPLALGIDLAADTLPRQPVGPVLSAPDQGYSIKSRVEQELGNSAGLERVTFFVPNGWDGNDGRGICDPADLKQWWRGRTEGIGGGWRVTLDSLGEMDQDIWRELEALGGHRFTNVGSVIRDDGSTFSGTEAFEVLDRVRLGLNLALGRRTTCALPVGWRGEDPVWCRWRSAPIDAYRVATSSSHWLDETIAHQQIGEIVSLVLDFTDDVANRGALRPALAYYVTANGDVQAELSVAIPVSGLQLLAYYRFVTQRKAYSEKAWNDKITEKQLRLLLDEVKVDTVLQPHFRHLIAARDRLALTAAPRDALGVIMKMRNVVTHPTRDTSDAFSVYEWAEAGMTARYWLCLALLNTVGYEGRIADVMGATPRWPGQLRNPPWAP